MDILRDLAGSPTTFSCIDMHTTGEPTRIIYQGYPPLTGTLLAQRSQAKRSYDHIRRKLLLEPRGHVDMYGAILRPDTEHTTSGAAHMGVLFLTNEGYSTMCGHATIALGRFLVDTHDLQIFPRRNEVQFDETTKTVELILHAPCGLVHITVPTNAEGSRSDPTRPVSHISVPSFATGINIEIPLPSQYTWPELETRGHITADFSYGGTFYCFVKAAELGFPHGLNGKINLPAYNLATKQLKAAINANPDLRHLFSHPEHTDLGFLYSVIVVDNTTGVPLTPSTRAETGLCFFADQQIDRSPTGSGVAARIALAYAKSSIQKGEAITYHSRLSNSLGGKGGFIGSVHEVEGEQDGFPIVRVRVEGYASYTGSSTFVVEESDALGDDGVLFERLE